MESEELPLDYSWTSRVFNENKVPGLSRQRKPAIPPHHKNFGCAYCGYRSRYRGDVYKHQSRRHPNADRRLIKYSASGAVVPFQGKQEDSLWNTPVGPQSAKPSYGRDSTNILDYRQLKPVSKRSHTVASLDLNVCEEKEMSHLTVSTMERIVSPLVSDASERKPCDSVPSIASSGINPLHFRNVLSSEQSQQLPTFESCFLSARTVPALNDQVSVDIADTDRAETKIAGIWETNKPSGNKSTHPNIKPYMCSSCGLRANFKSDIHKHIRNRSKTDSNHNGHVIILDKQTARDTIMTYLSRRHVAPDLNSQEKTIESINFSTHLIMQPGQDCSRSGSPPASTLQPAPSNDIDDGQNEQATVSDGLAERSCDDNGNQLRKPRIPHFVGYKRTKCKRCFYRSNWKGDLVRHVTKEHNGIPSQDICFIGEIEAASSFERYEKTFGRLLRSRLLIGLIVYKDVSWSMTLKFLLQNIASTARAVITDSNDNAKATHRLIRMSSEFIRLMRSTSIYQDDEITSSILDDDDGSLIDELSRVHRRVRSAANKVARLSRKHNFTETQLVAIREGTHNDVCAHALLNVSNKTFSSEYDIKSDKLKDAIEKLLQSNRSQTAMDNESTQFGVSLSQPSHTVEDSKDDKRAFCLNLSTRQGDQMNDSTCGDRHGDKCVLSTPIDMTNTVGCGSTKGTDQLRAKPGRRKRKFVDGDITCDLCSPMWVYKTKLDATRHQDLHLFGKGYECTSCFASSYFRNVIAMHNVQFHNNHAFIRTIFRFGDAMCLSGASKKHCHGMARQPIDVECAGELYNACTSQTLQGSTVHGHTSGPGKRTAAKCTCYKSPFENLQKMPSLCKNCPTCSMHDS